MCVKLCLRFMFSTLNTNRKARNPEIMLMMDRMEEKAMKFIFINVLKTFNCSSRWLSREPRQLRVKSPLI